MPAIQHRLGAAPLTRNQLIEWTTTVARDVRRGRNEVHSDIDQRWHVRLHCDEQVDIWLISWTTDQGTQLHDHGGSAGGFTIVSGTLSEAVWSPADGGLRESAREADETIAFGDNYVHDVRNLGAETAVSVHAYSPPLSLMNYYDTEGDQLIRLASVWTDDPGEPAIERNHLEWRLHPGSGASIEQARPDQRWIVVCTEGYTSSLAAASLLSLGLIASDVIGGIYAWREAGFPVADSVSTVETVVSPHAQALGVS